MDVQERLPACSGIRRKKEAKGHLLDCERTTDGGTFCHYGEAEAQRIVLLAVFDVFEWVRFLRLLFFAGLATCMPGSKAATCETQGRKSSRSKQRKP